MNILATLEGFWVDYGAIISIASAGIVLIGAAITFFKNNSLSKEAVDRTAQAETKLSTDHQHLSGEHKALSTEHQMLLERSADVKASVSSMCTAFQEDRIQRAKDQAEQQAQYASLSDAQKRLDDHAREIGKFADEFRRLAAENAELKAENQRLRDRLGLADELVRQQRYAPDRGRENDEQEL